MGFSKAFRDKPDSQHIAKRRETYWRCARFASIERLKFKAKRFGSSCLAAVLASLYAGPAFAQCRVCDEVIEVNAEYASCFTRSYDRLLSELAHSQSGRVTFDMAECGGKAGDGERGGLLVMPSLTGRAKPPKSVYVLDRAYTDCLKRLIEDRADSIDPTAVFDLYEQCDS